MEELIQKITKEAGINEAQAEKAIEAVVNFIKDKLPPMMHGVVDNFLHTDTSNDANDPLL